MNRHETTRPPFRVEGANSPFRVEGPSNRSPRPRWLRQVRAILVKDLTLEARSKEVLTSTLVFAVMVLIIFNFAVDLRGENLVLVTPGVLWVAFTFAAVLGLNRAFAQEKDRGALEGLLLAPVEPGAIYMAKFLGNLIFTAITEAVILPVFAAFFNFPALRLDLLLIVALGTIGFVAVGTLFAAIAAHTRAREVMLPILLFPIVVPVVIAAVKATALLVDGRDWAEVTPWVSLLLAFDAIFVVVSFLMFGYVFEE